MTKEKSPATKSYLFSKDFLMFKKKLFNHVGNPTGIASCGKDPWIKEVSEVGSKSWAPVGSGQRFIMVTVSNVISKTFSFSSIPLFPLTCLSGFGKWVGGEKSCFLLNRVSEGDTFPFHASPFVLILTSFKVDLKDMRTCW